MQSSESKVQILCRIRDKFDLLDCFAALAMTGMCGAAYLGAGWQYCLGFSDHPAAARHPSNGGELGMALFILAREHRDRGDPVNVICLRIRVRA